MSTPHRKTAADAKQQQQQAAESEAATQAAAKRNQPHEIAERALMQRQGKNLHRQDGK